MKFTLTFQDLSEDKSRTQSSSVFRVRATEGSGFKGVQA